MALRLLKPPTAPQHDGLRFNRTDTIDHSFKTARRLMRDGIHSIDNILCRRHTVITVKAGHAVINGDRSCLHVVFHIAVGSYGRSGQITVLEVQSGTQAYRFSRAAVRFVGQVRRLSGFCAVQRSPYSP